MQEMRTEVERWSDGEEGPAVTKPVSGKWSGGGSVGGCLMQSSDGDGVEVVVGDGTKPERTRDLSRLTRLLAADRVLRLLEVRREALRNYHPSHSQSLLQSN